MVKDTKDITPQRNLSLLAGYLKGDIKPELPVEYYAIGYAAREMRDLTQWVIGKLAFEFTEKYKRGSLKEFCKNIGYGGMEGTVEVYRWTAEKYLEKYGKLPYDFDGQLLSYSYYRTVAKTDDPMQWIQLAQDESLNVRQLRKRLDGAPAPDLCSHLNLKTITVCLDCGIKTHEN